MILHVTFSDGSNPWVFYGNRQQVAKHWKRWIKYHPGTAQPLAWAGKYKCSFCKSTGRFYVCNPENPYDPNSNDYWYLGHALRALERLGGGEQ